MVLPRPSRSSSVWWKVSHTAGLTGSESLGSCDHSSSSWTGESWAQPGEDEWSDRQGCSSGCLVHKGGHRAPEQWSHPVNPVVGEVSENSSRTKTGDWMFNGRNIFTCGLDSYSTQSGGRQRDDRLCLWGLRRENKLFGVLFQSSGMERSSQMINDLSL